MRTNLFRGVLTLTCVLAFSASASAQFQNEIIGSVIDQDNQPVADATVTVDQIVEEGERFFSAEVQTDADGGFVVVNLQQGQYRISAAKEDVGLAAEIMNVRQGRNAYRIQILPPGALSGDGVDAQESAQAGMAAMAAGDFAVAIERFNEVIGEAPDCLECLINIGMSQSNLRQYEEAIVTFQRIIEMDPMSADAFNGLAGAYNGLSRFDEAAEAGARAAELAGSVAGGGADAQILYNQGVIFWNAGQYEQAKSQFEDAIAVDASYSPAYYQLGMSNLNLGQLPDALAAFQGYLEVDPNGERSDEVRGFVTQLGGQ